MLLTLLQSRGEVAQPVTGGTASRRTPRLAPWSAPVLNAPLRPDKARRRRRRDDELLALFKT